MRLQNLVNENSKQIWNFELKELSISNQRETLTLNLDEGAYKMLSTGNWDATSQLLNEEERIKITISKLFVFIICNQRISIVFVKRFFSCV